MNTQVCERHTPSFRAYMKEVLEKYLLSHISIESMKYHTIYRILIWCIQKNKVRYICVIM
jgi:hypothetical protein